MSKEFFFTRNKGEMPDYLSIVSGSRCARIKIDDIEVIEQEGRKLHIVTAERDYTYYEKINVIAVTLVGRGFYRAMASLIINFEHIREMHGSVIEFYSGQTVTMGKNSMCQARQAYKRFLLKYPPYTNWDDVNNVAENKMDMKFKEIGKGQPEDAEKQRED